MQTRRDVLIDLVHHVVLDKDKVLYPRVVVLPTFNDVKNFSKEFYKFLDEVPDWLQPNISARKIGEFRYDFGLIRFVNSPEKLRGISLSSLYFSDRLSYVKKMRLKETIYPAMRDFNCFTEFEDGQRFEILESDLILNRNIKL